MGNFLNTRERGLRSEVCAQAFLESIGYVFIERNFRWKGGEIDLVMRCPSGAVTFVEVRSVGRSATHAKWIHHGISFHKRRCLRATAQVYQRARAWTTGLPVRFDLVWVVGGRCEHWRNVEI